MNAQIYAENSHNQALAELRKESLDLFNRLHSIARDSQFVNDIRDHYGEIPIIRTPPPLYFEFRSMNSETTQQTCDVARGMSTPQQ